LMGLSLGLSNNRSFHYANLGPSWALAGVSLILGYLGPQLRLSCTLAGS